MHTMSAVWICGYPCVYHR